MYIGKGLIRYSSHGEVQCYHMLKSTSLMQVLFPRSPSLFDSCLCASIWSSAYRAMFENITSPLCHLHLIQSIRLSRKTTIPEKKGGGRDQICEMLNFSSLSLVLCFMTPNGLSLVSRPAEVKGQDRGVARGQDGHYWPYVRSISVLITRQEETHDTCWCIHAARTQLCSVRCRIAFTGFRQLWAVADGAVPKPEESKLEQTRRVVLLITVTHKHIMTAQCSLKE